MRIFQTLYDAVNETARDLKVRGITVECNSYQDKKLEGEDRFVKELMGVAFKVDKPLLRRDKVIEYIFKDQRQMFWQTSQSWKLLQDQTRHVEQVP